MSVAEILSGNRRTLSRFLTKVENNRESVNQELAELFPYSAKGHIIGITGAPGTGKSSLVTLLTKRLRLKGQTVAIVAVDPTSPFSGGAILGDRIRMRDLSGDRGVYIRSMATRGNLGGLASTTQDVARVLLAAGFDNVIIETVGAGQSEVEIVQLAHTTVVVEAPGLGDEIQAIKAGILEIADILVVNKSDLPGADRTERALKAMLELGHPTKYENHDKPLWIPPIIRISTKDQTGFDELIDSIMGHRNYLEENDLWALLLEKRMMLEFNNRLKISLFKRFDDAIEDDAITAMIKRITQYEIDPQQAVDELLKTINISISRE